MKRYDLKHCDLKGFNLIDFNKTIKSNKQFNSTQSWLVYTSDGLYIQSYNTLVAKIVNNVCYEFGKYSQTTSKQVTCICNKYGFEKGGVKNEL